MRTELIILRDLVEQCLEERQILKQYGIVTNKKDKGKAWRGEAEQVMIEFHANAARREALLDEYTAYTKGEEYVATED